MSAGLCIETQANPLINLQPIGLDNITLGLPISLNVGASGNNVRYQWRRNGVNIPGATSPLYSIGAFFASDGGAYSVVVSDDTGVTTSETVRLLPALLSLPLADNLNAVPSTISATFGSGSRRGNNFGATREASEPRHDGKRGNKTIWFKWSAALSVFGGNVTFNTLGSDFDTILAVYTGTSIGNLTELVANDDSAGYLASSVSFSVDPAVVYWIAVTGLADASGNIVVNWDLVANTHKLPKILRKPKDKSSERGDSVDLSLESTNGGPLTVQWFLNNNLVSTTPSSLLITDLQPAKVGRYHARVFNPVTGLEVFTEPVSVQIHEAADGQIHSDILTQDKYPEANDTLAASSSPQLAGLTTAGRRRRVSLARGYSGTQTFNTYGSVSEAGEPNHCGVVGGASQWFGLQAEANGFMTIDTEGSDFDTVVAVYTGDGTSFSTLQPVACNNDFGGNRWSKLTFPAAANVVYYVALDGVNAAQGLAYLHYVLDPPPAMTPITNQSFNEDNSVQLNFSLSDPTTPLNSLSITASSTVPSLVPNANLVFTGTGATRTLTVTPAANRAGTTTIFVYVSDNWQTTTSSFQVTVSAVNDAPLARNDSAQFTQGSGPVKLSILKLLANDLDVDGDAVILHNVAGSSVNGGAVSRDANWVYYTPPAGFISDSISYTIRDGQGGISNGSIGVSFVPAINNLGPNHLSLVRLENGQVRLRYAGIPGRTYGIQGSTDLSNWTRIGEATAGPTGAYEFIDVNAASFTVRYYRSVWP